MKRALIFSLNRFRNTKHRKTSFINWPAGLKYKKGTAYAVPDHICQKNNPQTSDEALK